MKYRTVEELNRAYWRVKLRSMGVALCSLLLWAALYLGIPAAVVHFRGPGHELPRSIMLPFGLGWLFGGFAFMVTSIYLYGRRRLVRCPHCNKPAHEIRGGDPDPVCQECGKSMIEPETVS
jgi:hypothetical protein